MAIIDAEGRLLGRVNVFDAAAAVVVAAIAALAYVGYGLLRMPEPPRITDVTPSTLTAGAGLRVGIRGDNLLPYLRVFVQRTGESKTVMHETTKDFDSYTLMNYARGALFIESPDLAEVRLPDGLLPGTYDFVLHDESKIVYVRPAAVTIVADRSATMRADLTVRFAGHASVLALVREKDVEIAPSSDAPAQIVSIERRGPAKGAPDEDAMLVCVVRLPVVKSPGGWMHGLRTLKAGAPFTFQNEQYIVQGTIESFTVSPR
jgi:hypothetical protein